MAKGGKRNNSGRKRKPRLKHEIEGTLRADRHGSAEVSADGVPLMPRDLPPRAIELWERIESQLIQWGASEIDTDGIADMCRWHAAYRDEYDAANWKEAARCWDKFNSIACRYGLTLADRAKLQVNSAGSDEGREGRNYGVVG